MGFSKAAANYRHEGPLPLRVHNSVVRSLYGDVPTLMVGSMTMVLAPIVLYFRVFDTIQLAFSCIFLLLGAVRIFAARSFQTIVTGKMARESLVKWERRYARLGAIYVGVLGCWFFAGFARSDDEFVHIMALALTLSYLVGISGRNFGSEQVVRWQVVAAAIPLISAVVLFGDGFYLVFAGFLLPFFVSIWMVSSRLRNMMFHAVLTSDENRTIAKRFDAALNTIRHGMVMVDRNGVIAVANSQFAELTGHENKIPLGSHMSSLDLGAALMRRDDHGALVPVGEITFADEVMRCLEEETNQTFVFMCANAMIIEAEFFSTRNGGVVLLEDVSDQVASEEEIRKLASFDALTGLSNRRYFLREVQTQYSDKDGLKPSTVYFLDLDNFKEINDTLGHSIGDKLLISVAARLRSMMPDHALISRFGGDEFVIFVPGAVNDNQASSFAKQLIGEAARPLLIDGNHINAGASVGIAMAPAHGNDTDGLLKNADAALYDAKALGRNDFAFYTQALGERIEERRRLETDLRMAIENGDLEVYFQPLVDVTEKKITTCEALVRWRHPERGMIPPAEFIPVAEEIGLISKLGEFVFRESALQCSKWPDDISVAVNVSSLQFKQSDICSMVRKILMNSGLDPSRLEIEVTESAMLEDIEATSAILNQLSKLGVRISLDDFGTGFSSLSYLRTLPLDKVKVDRSFIEDIVDDERSLIVLSGITDLTQRLGLSVVVEGIETRQQMTLLEENISMDQVQGFLFGRPLPAQDIGYLFGSDDLIREKFPYATV